MKKRKMGKWLALAAFAGMVSVTGVLAYFTDRKEAENVVTMGSVEIKLEEPSYPGNDSGRGSSYLSGTEDTKRSSGDQYRENPAYIRQEVWIPLGDVRVFNPEGGCTALEDAELVTYTVLDGWERGRVFKRESGTGRHFLYAAHLQL